MRSQSAFFEGWVVLMGIPALFLVAFIYPLLPTLHEWIVCGVRGFLGCDCPGCGLTRSFGALTHGRFRESIDFHPLGIVIALWLCYFWGRGVLAIVLQRQVKGLLTQGQRDFLLGSFLIALFVQWIVKLWLL